MLFYTNNTYQVLECQFYSGVTDLLRNLAILLTDAVAILVLVRFLVSVRTLEPWQRLSCLL